MPKAPCTRHGKKNTFPCVPTVSQSRSQIPRGHADVRDRPYGSALRADLFPVAAHFYPNIGVEDRSCAVFAVKQRVIGRYCEPCNGFAFRTEDHVGPSVWYKSRRL